MWSAIKSGMSVLFGGSSNNGMDVVMGVGKWIDEQQYTDEEQAENLIERSKLYSAYLAQVMDENTERSRTRRSIAIWIIRSEILMLFLSIALSKFDPATSEYIFKVATHEPMNILVLGVGAFFFGTHLVRATK